MHVSSDDDDDDLLGIGQSVFSSRSLKDASRKESKMFSFLDQCVAEETERFSSHVKMQKLMKENSAVKALGDGNIELKSFSIPMYGVGEEQDDNYWDRIRQETAKSTTSAKARRKRQLDDAIDGLHSCNNDDGNDEEYWKDRSKRLGEASALTTALSTTLGVRKVFHVKQLRVPADLIENIKHFTPFASQEEAIRYLETILLEICPKQRSDKSPYLSLVNTIRDSIATQNLSNLLMSQVIVRWSVKYQKRVPVSLQKWLWRVLCSSNPESAQGSRITLKGILRSRITDDRICYSGGCGVIQMEHLALMMQYTFGLQIVAQISEPHQKLSSIQTCGSTRLLAVLDVWSTAFENDAVSLHPQKGCKDKITSDDSICASATSLLGSLVLASVDPSFHIGTGSLQALQQLITTIVNLIQNRFYSVGITTGDTTIAKQSVKLHNTLDDWLANVASDVIEHAQELKEGGPGSADADDSKGYFPLCLMVKSIPMSRMRSTLVEVALKRCFRDVTNWNQKRSAVVTAHCKKLHLSECCVPLHWETLASAELGLSCVSLAGENVTSDGPQLHAIIELVKAAVEVALALSATNPQDNNDGGVYGSKTNAAYIYLSFEALENHCTSIKKIITCVFVNQHLRRAKELLTQISTYFKHMKNEAMKLSGNSNSLQVQKTLETWIGDDEEESSQPSSQPSS